MSEGCGPSSYYLEQNSLSTYLAEELRKAGSSIQDSTDLYLRNLAEDILEKLARLGSYAVGPNSRKTGRKGALVAAVGNKLDNAFKDLDSRAAVPADAPVCQYCQQSPGILTCHHSGCDERPHHACFVSYWGGRGKHALVDAPQPGYCMYHAGCQPL